MSWPFWFFSMNWMEMDLKNKGHESLSPRGGHRLSKRSFAAAQDFACGLPLRSRPQSGSSLSPRGGRQVLPYYCKSISPEEWRKIHPLILGTWISLSALLCLKIFLFLQRFPAVPAGLNSLIYSYPALACWLFSLRPSGTCFTDSVAFSDKTYRAKSLTNP
jgi:hypothetical protein